MRRWRWSLRRWSVRNVVRRLMLPARRRRASKVRDVVCRPFAKASDARLTNGPAVVVGDFSGAYGLARGASYDLELLKNRHSSVQTIDVGPYLRAHADTRLPLGAACENLYLFCQPDTYGAIFGLLEPSEVAGAYRVGRWVWETPIFPRDWRFAEELVHEVWTPSAYSAEAIRGGTGLPVTVVRHAVSPPPNTGPDMRGRLGIPKDAFMGLAVMDIQSCPVRKNPWAHVLAWREAFGGDTSAILVLKLRVSKRTQLVVDELRDLTSSVDNVCLLTDELDGVEIASLHHSADMFLSLHRAEGFGLGIVEALLLEKPVVATDWSANAEYGPEFGTYHPVPYALVPYRDWMGHYRQRDFVWADADVGEAAKLMKHVYDVWSEQPGELRVAQLPLSTATSASPVRPARMNQLLANRGAS